jgi:hypothetical protein
MFAVSTQAASCKKRISKAESALTFGHNQLFEDLSQPESKLFLLAQISSEGRIDNNRLLIVTHFLLS